MNVLHGSAGAWRRRFRPSRLGRLPFIGVTLAALAAGLLLPAGDLAADPIADAKQLIATRGCAACHFVPGVPQAMGTTGPSLKGIASRDRIVQGRLDNTPENLRRWLANPKDVLPGTMMPNFGLDDEEISALITFFETLK